VTNFRSVRFRHCECFRRITRNFKSDYFLAPARTFIFADGFSGMHLVAATVKHNVKSFSKRPFHRRHETRTNNETLIFLTAFYLCLCTLLCCVTDKISVDQLIIRNAKPKQRPQWMNFYGE